jgi:hypothetical protein
MKETMKRMTRNNENNDKKGINTQPKSRETIEKNKGNDYISKGNDVDK